MEEIFKQYGGAIILAMVASILLTIFVNFQGTGFLNFAGNDIGVILKDQNGMTTSKVDTVLNRHKPVISVIDHLDEKQTYYLIDDFTISILDSDNKDALIWKRDVINTEGKQGAFVGANGNQDGKVDILSISDSTGHVYYDSILISYRI